MRWQERLARIFNSRSASHLSFREKAKHVFKGLEIDDFKIMQTELFKTVVFPPVHYSSKDIIRIGSPDQSPPASSIPDQIKLHGLEFLALEKHSNDQYFLSLCFILPPENPERDTTMVWDKAYVSPQIANGDSVAACNASKEHNYMSDPIEDIAVKREEGISILQSYEEQKAKAGLRPASFPHNYIHYKQAVYLSQPFRQLPRIDYN